MKFQLFNDSSVSIKDYLIDDFDDAIEDQKKGILQIEKIFEEFCKINAIQKDDYKSIFSFIEKNKKSLSRYLSQKGSAQQQDFSIEAQFVEYFRPIPKIYDFIKKIYLGSIISGFIEYKTENLKTDVELLFDTNFISERITILQSYIRFIVKGLLGWLSFVTIHFNGEHRAIHDFAGSSVMIRQRAENT